MSSPAVMTPAGGPAVAGPEETPRRARRRGLPPALLGLIGLAALVLLVEILPRVGIVDERYFPTSSEIGSALGDLVGESTFWTAVGDTMQGWALGLAIASVAGIVLGVERADDRQTAVEGLHEVAVADGRGGTGDGVLLVGYQIHALLFPLVAGVT